MGVLYTSKDTYFITEKETEFCLQYQAVVVQKR